MYTSVLKYVLFILFISLSCSFYVISYFEIFPVSVYGFLIALYFVCQIIFALRNRYLMNKLPLSEKSVTLLIVGYREDLDYWKNCINSVLKQDYSNISKIVISIDGNEEDDMYMYNTAKEILDADLNLPYEKYIILLNPHGGKREAICHGLTYIKKNMPDVSYTLFIDSDTVLTPSATKHLVNCIDGNEKNGCATGSLLVFDNHLLGKIVNARYAYAFNVERAAMSCLGVMNCCSGPLSIYKNEVITEEFINEFLTQTFMSVKCGPGDDRHLTNMFLIRGWKSKQTHLSIGYTEAPKTFIRFIKQQTRWMRSFFREQYWQMRAIPKQSVFLAIITQYEILYPLFVFVWLIRLTYHKTPEQLIKITISTIGIIVLRTFILLCIMKDCSYIYNLFYLPMFMFILLPVKIYSLCTMKEMNWITSTRIQIINKCDIELFLIFSLIILWNCSIVYSISTLFLK